MGEWGWGLVGLVIMGLFVAWLGPVYGSASMIGTCLVLGTIFRLLDKRAARKQSSKRQPARSKDRTRFPGESLGESITRIVEDKNEFYRAWLQPSTGRDKVILSLLELYAFVQAVQSVWPDEAMSERRQRFLDEVHTATFALLRSKQLADNAQSFEALTRECYARWGSAFAKGEESRSPSGFHWLAKEVFLTLRPDEAPDLAVIDGLAEVFTHSVVAWTESLRSSRGNGPG